MNQIIYKYPLDIIDIQTLFIPNDAEILSVQFQGDTLTLWAKQNITKENTKGHCRQIHIIGTGNEFPGIVGLKFLGTAQEPNSSFPLVWHVFERRV
jgi:hypothetical protein